MAYYCYKCGYPIQDGMNFCSKCVELSRNVQSENTQNLG